jgi:hypothetical protein
MPTHAPLYVWSAGFPDIRRELIKSVGPSKGIAGEPVDGVKTHFIPYSSASTAKCILEELVA